MKKASICLLVLTLSFSVLFSAFGYARITGTLTLHGLVSAAIQSGVFISDVTQTEAQDAAVTVNGYAQHVLNTTVSLGESADSSISLEVEFFNNNGKDMAYGGAMHTADGYDNGDIAYTVSNILDGDLIKEGETLTLTLTFHYRDGVSALRELRAVIGFLFAEVVIFDDTPGHFEPGEQYNTLVQRILENSKGYGLNDNHKGYVIHDALARYRVLYSTDNVQGGNIDKVLDSLQAATANIDFLFEYVSDTEYVVYFFSRTDATVGNVATVYKQYYHEKDGTWEAGSALLGHATIKEVEIPSGGTHDSILPADWIIGPKPTQ